MVYVRLSLFVIVCGSIFSAFGESCMDPRLLFLSGLKKQQQEIEKSFNKIEEKLINDSDVEYIISLFERSQKGKELAAVITKKENQEQPLAIIEVEELYGPKGLYFAGSVLERDYYCLEKNRPHPEFNLLFDELKQFIKKQGSRMLLVVLQ